LRRRKHRITRPRREILAALAAEHGPFTIEQIHQRLKRRPCNLVTVYRNLAVLEELELVRRCDFGDGTYRYELNAEGHHHHIICRVCARVETLELCAVTALERLARRMGYRQVTHSLELFGVCPKCRERQAHRAGPVRLHTKAGTPALSGRKVKRAACNRIDPAAEYLT
jgi:Fur family ferric uptake transcriptional regulator